MGAAREEQRTSPSAYADGLTDWLRGEDSAEAEAARLNLAETLIRWHHLLKSKEKA